MSKINKKRQQNDVNWHQLTVSWRRSGVFLFNFEHILILVLLFPTLALNLMYVSYLFLL